MRLAQRARNQAIRFGTEFLTGWEVTSVETGTGGEPHVVRQDLERARPGREKRRVAKLFFGQMTDTHVVDEESPLRVGPREL